MSFDQILTTLITSKILGTSKAKSDELLLLIAQYAWIIPKETFTFTFCEVAENHVGMEKIGELTTKVYSVASLKRIQANISNSINTPEEVKCKLIKLDDPENKEMEEAAVLIIRNGIQLFAKNYNTQQYDRQLIDITRELERETKNLDVDKKAFMKGRVVNKLARWNLCYADFSQEPDYEQKKGTVINFKDVPVLNSIRSNLDKFFGKKAKNLFGELNHYYDVNKCGIGFHGDSERKIVIGLRVGASMKLKFQWYKGGNPEGNSMSMMLNDGDMYIMSSKAVGHDWKRRKIYTLRHAAGCEKYTKVNRDK